MSVDRSLDIGVALVLASWLLVPQLPAAVGSPFTTVFDSEQYQAEPQNWCVVQDQHGFIWAGNGEGVLLFDGVSWTLIPVSNGSIVRSLAVDPEGTVWVGAVGELGYLADDQGGRPTYHSLTDLLEPAPARPLADVWQTFVTEDGVLFWTQSRLYRFHQGRFQSWPLDCSLAPSLIDGRLYCNQGGIGLTVLDGDSFQQVPGGEQLVGLQARVMLPYTGQTLLIGCRDQLFLFDLVTPEETGEGVPQLRPFATGVDHLLRRHRLYHAIRLPDGRFALATMTGGALVIGAEGDHLLTIDRSTGLPDASVWHLFSDHQQGLWLSLNRGLARIEMASPVSPVTTADGIDGTVEVITRHQGTLYVGTSIGLYRLAAGRFHQVVGVDAPCWDLLSCTDGADDAHHLLAAGTCGVYQIRSGRGQMLAPARSAFVLYRSTANPGLLFVGTRDGLRVLRQTAGDAGRDDGAWQDLGQIEAISGEIRSIGEDSSGALWLGTLIDGSLQVRLEPAADGGCPAVRSLTRFGLDSGLASLASIKVVKMPGDSLVFATPAGMYQLDGDRFVASHLFGAELAGGGELGVQRVVADSDGRYWLSLHEHLPLVARPLPDGTFNVTEVGLRRLPARDVHAISPEPDGGAWIGTTKGLFRFDASRVRATPDPVVYLRSVVAGGGTELGPALLPPESSSSLSSPLPVVLPYRRGSLMFTFACPSYDGIASNRYSYRLDGYDTKWSRFSAGASKEYTHLPEGSYRFSVRARDVYGSVSAPATFTFTIRPPWYRTWWSYLAGAVTAACLVAAVVRVRSGQLVRQRDRLERLVARRTSQLACKKNQLETVNNIVRSINSEFGFDSLTRVILNELGILEHLHQACFLVRQPGSRRFRVRAASGQGQVPAARLEAALEQLVRHPAGGDRLAEDVFRLDRGAADDAGAPAAGALVVLLFRDDGEVREALTLLFDSPEPLAGADLELLCDLRDHIMAALIKARLLHDLQAISDRKSEVLRFAAHDFRRPMGNIVGFLELFARQIRDDRFDPVAGARRFDELAGVGRQTVKLLERLLDLSAIESGKRELSLVPVTLPQLLAACLDGHRHDAGKKGITLQLLPPGELPPVLADPMRITQVVDNLLSNAVKYTHPGGEVKLSCTLGDDEVVTCVVDNGQGLAPQDLEHVFRSFRPLSAQPTGGETSTGLGLAIARTIVERHGGRIWVESEQGRGAAFSFSLLLCRSNGDDGA